MIPFMSSPRVWQCEKRLPRACCGFRRAVRPPEPCVRPRQLDRPRAVVQSIVERQEAHDEEKRVAVRLVEKKPDEYVLRVFGAAQRGIVHADVLRRVTGLVDRK